MQDIQLPFSYNRYLGNIPSWFWDEVAFELSYWGIVTRFCIGVIPTAYCWRINRNKCKSYSPQKLPHKRVPVNWETKKKNEKKKKKRKENSE